MHGRLTPFLPSPYPPSFSTSSVGAVPRGGPKPKTATNPSQSPDSFVLLFRVLASARDFGFLVVVHFFLLFRPLLQIIHDLILKLYLFLIYKFVVVLLILLLGKLIHAVTTSTFSAPSLPCGPSAFALPSSGSGLVPPLFPLLCHCGG